MLGTRWTSTWSCCSLLRLCDQRISVQTVLHYLKFKLANYHFAVYLIFQGRQNVLKRDIFSLWIAVLHLLIRWKCGYFDLQSFLVLRSDSLTALLTDLGIASKAPVPSSPHQRTGSLCKFSGTASLRKLSFLTAVLLTAAASTNSILRSYNNLNFNKGQGPATLPTGQAAHCLLSGTCCFEENEQLS